MGHLVNPITYRLGVSKCWNSVWTKNIFSDYSFLLKNDNNIYLFFRRFFDLKFVIQSGYIFSHVKIIRESYRDYFIIYFYDGGSLERSDNMRHIFLSNDFQTFTLTNIFFLSLSSFLKLYHWNFSGFQILRNFKFTFLCRYFVKCKNLSNLKITLRKGVFSSLFSVVRKKIKIQMILELSLNNFLFFYFFAFFKLFKFFSNIFYFSSLMLFFFNKIFPFCLKFAFFSFCFPFFFAFNKIFNLYNMFRLFQFKGILKFFFLLRWKMLVKVRHYTKLIRTLLKYFSFTRYFLHFLGDFFFFSVRINSRLKHLLFSLFNHLFLFKNDFKVRVILKKLDVTELTANIVSKYLSVRLRQRFQLKEALFPILRHLSHTFFVRGFRIVCAGRFTRKEIALYDLRTYSSVPFSGVSSYLDFSLSEVILKYSICGIKVWLHKHVVSENFFSIYGIGLNFVQKPEISQDFLKFLQFRLNFISQPYDENFFDKKVFTFLRNFVLKNKAKHKSNISRVLRIKVRNSFVKYSFRLLPAVDFFFVNLNIFQKYLKNKKKINKLKKNKIAL